MIPPKLGCPFCHGDLELVATYNFMVERSYEYKCTSCKTTVEHVVDKNPEEVDIAYIEEAAHAREFGDRF